MQVLKISQATEAISDNLITMIFESVSDLDSDRIHSVSLGQNKDEMCIRYYPPSSGKELKSILITINIQ